MKKIMTLFAAAVIAGAAWAHTTSRVMPMNRALPQKQEVSVKPDFEATKQNAPVQKMVHGKDVAKNIIAKQYATMPTKARQAAMESVPLPRYNKPEGSWYCGIDKLGTYMWANYITIVGSWMNGYDTWTWPNYTLGATSYEYQTIFGIDYPKYKTMGIRVDEDGTFNDSLPALVKGDMSSYYSFRLPLQIAENGAGKDSFALAVGVSDRLDTLIGSVLTIGGIYNPIDDDGFWPMTQARFFDEINDFSMDDVWYVDTVKNTFEYIIGSSTVTNIEEDVQGADSLVTYKPSAFMQYFEKPMSPMYVHDITLAINAYEIQKDGMYYTDPTFDSLFLTIADTLGNILYTTGAGINDTTNMLYMYGALVNFKIETEDSFGEKTIGMTLDQPFIVTVSGLNRPGNNFGIYTGVNLLTFGSTYVMDANSQSLKYYYPGDPFLMFNGVMNTLEDGSKAMGYTAMSDTIDVNVVEEDNEWIALYANGDMENYLPVIAATDLLYDTTSLQYLYEIEGPDWAEVDMEIYTDQQGYNYWDEYGVYFLYIYGDATNTEVEAPKVGDEIIFSQYGKKIVYRVVSAPSTGLNNVKYLNDGKRYDVLGNEVDENYKGVVIRNGKKMLQ